MLSLPQSASRSPLLKFLVVLFLLSIAAFGGLSGYLSGQFAWQKVPEIGDMQRLKTLQQQGLELPGWRSLDHQVLEIGGHKWSVQAIVPPDQVETATPQDMVLLMLCPQTWHRDMPQLEWMDVNGVRQWKADSQQQLQFSVNAETGAAQTQPVKVTARFLRGWNQERTYAVLQWYAWSTGGGSAPGSWFWTNQMSQLFDRRHTSWVAVSILIPIKPLGEIASAQPEAEALGKRVQSTLMTQTFR